MTKRHDDVFDAVLSGVPTARDRSEKPSAGTRFLKRGNAISERLSGAHEEKTLHWIDPEDCRMWARHNRDYALLTEENCRDLIDGIRSQGRQEFPAIVRRVSNGEVPYEVICGARRHFAISWLQANNYPQFKYLVEVRDLSDEEAFRLADIENRDREDISDYERARDYAEAVELYYGGKQKDMAARLEVTTVWLSRYLELARLPSEIVEAFPSIRDIRELHARTLKPLLKETKGRSRVLAEARLIALEQNEARQGAGAFVDATRVVSRLKSCVAVTKERPRAREYKGSGASAGMALTVHGRKHRLEFDPRSSRDDLEAAFRIYLDEAH
ncbi:MAG: ParB/RepB/Spo0J family partition protein [Paracoccaceae bacterium]